MLRFRFLILVMATALNVAQGDDAIKPVGRQSSSGTYEFFRSTVLGKEGSVREDAASVSSRKDALEAVAASRFAIGYGPLPDAKAGVKVLKVAVTGGKPIEPTEENVRSGKYPLARPLLILAPKAAGSSAHYLAWIRSTAGQQIAQENGFVQIADPKQPPTDKPARAELRVGGSDSLVNLGGQLTEAYMKKYSDVRIVVSGGGTGSGIAGLIAGDLDLAHSVRSMMPQEKKAASSALGEVEEHAICYEALAVFVNKENPVETISLGELAAIYGVDGKLNTWSDLSEKRKKQRDE